MFAYSVHRSRVSRASARLAAGRSPRSAQGKREDKPHYSCEVKRAQERSHKRRDKQLTQKLSPPHPPSLNTFWGGLSSAKLLFVNFA